MKVLHIIAGLSKKSGGPSRSSQGLVAALYKAGVDAWMWPLNGAKPWVQGVRCISGIVGFEQAERIPLPHFCQLKEFDLVHVHGIWDLRLHKIEVMCRKAGIPYVISPRGTLDPWALSVKRWKKMIALALYQRRDLKNAAAFHVTSAQEEKSVRAMGLTQLVILAPNGVDLPDVMPPRTNGGEVRTAIFLSRLHPGKGLLALADAWARVQPKGWRMKVVGPDAYGHKAEVVARLEQLGIRNQWEFVDMLDDVEKWSAYRGADLLIHPSVSENFGITIAEGLAAELPVIATKGAPWADLVERKCGWWIDLPGKEVERRGGEWKALDDALREAIEQSNNPNNRTILQEMGKRGRQLIEEKYTWQAVVENVKRGYEEIISSKRVK